VSKKSCPETATPGCQGYEHYGYSGPYWGPTYSSYAGIYDSDYSYTPTPEQQVTAEQQIKNSLAAVEKGKRHVATIAIFQ
jgi:hypothetical protein